MWSGNGRKNLKECKISFCPEKYHTILYFYELYLTTLTTNYIEMNSFLLWSVWSKMSGSKYGVFG